MKTHWKSTMISALGLLACTVSGDAQEIRGQELSWENYAAVKKHASRGGNDKHYLTIPWEETVLDGVNAGQKADKPVLLWLYFGDGRGNC